MLRPPFLPKPMVLLRGSVSWSLRIERVQPKAWRYKESNKWADAPPRKNALLVACPSRGPNDVCLSPSSCFVRSGAFLSGLLGSGLLTDAAASDGVSLSRR